MKSAALIIFDVAVMIASLELFRIAAHTFEAEEEFMVLGLVALLILLSTSLASQLKIPAAAVEIFAGILAALYGVHINDPLKVISGIGAYLLLFMVGLEVEVDLIRRSLGRTLTLGSLQWLIPAIVAVYMLGAWRSLSTALIIAATLATTSVALTFSILKGSGMLRSEYGQIVLTAAMVTDIIGMIALSLATAALDWRLALYAVILIAVLAVQPLMPRVAGRPFEFEVRLVIMTLIVLGAASEVLGMHGVLSSFILGVAVGESVRSRRILLEKLEGLATGFFVPFFFVTAGMSVDPAVVERVFIKGVIVGLVVFAVKWGIAYLYFGSYLKLHFRRVSLLSSSITPLLTVSIIGGLSGLNQGLITSEEYGIIMTAVIVTVLLSTLTSLTATRRSRV